MTNGITLGCHKIDGIATNGNMDESDSGDLTTETNGIASTSIEIKSDGWYKALNQDNFKKVKTRNSELDATAYCEMFTVSHQHWFASRTVSVGRYSSGNVINWNLFRGSSGGATVGITVIGFTNSLYTSSGGAYGKSYSYAACPIVTIPISQINMSSAYNSTTGWNLK